jgi:MYXO-CTERM domain-containing protein
MRSGTRNRIGATVLAAASVVVSGFGARPAQAAPPGTGDFQIYYYLTDKDGDRVRLMSEQDMQWIVGQARCECGQQILTRITYTGTTTDQEQLNVYAGQNCATAQQNGGLGQYKPCALLSSALPSAFQKGTEFLFSPIFLAYGVTGEQGIANAMPAGECSGLEGDGGIWMCSSTTSCQMGDFFMTGTVNQNKDMAGIHFDYQPPLSPPTNFTVSAGDSAVIINWEVTAVPDAGYRVLCADEDGNPIDNGVKFTPPTETSIVNGTIYFTAGNLCPDGPFDGSDPGDGDGDTGDGDGDTGDGDGDTGDGDGDTGDGDGDGDDDTGDGDGDTDDTGGCTPGELSCICTAEGTCDSPLECNGNICEEPTTGIHSLDWSYVCSEHLGYSTRQARIEGLENGKTYQFVVVAYDKAGNYVASTEEIKATPIPTNGLWDQCEAQGNICGEGWSCSVSDTPRGLTGMIGGLSLLGLAGLGGFVRSRRRRA